MNKKALINILLSNLLFVLYIIFVISPFLTSYAPANESTSEWAYKFAPIHYGLLFYPVFSIYTISLVKNILNVRYLRWLIYPICFLVLFVAVHMLFFIISPVILWFCLITIPIGFVVLLVIEGFAIFFDINDKNNNIAQQNNRIQKILNILGYIVVPILLLGMLLLTLLDITVITPNWQNDANNRAAAVCENHIEAITLATKNIKYNLKDLNFDEISKLYKKEFEENSYLYQQLIGGYEFVRAETGSYYSELIFEKKISDGSYKAYAFFTYTCDKTKKCKWNLSEAFYDSCQLYLNNDGNFDSV